MQSTSWETLDWRKYKLESRLPGEISITSNMQMTPLMAESEEELKSLLIKVKEWKSWLKAQHSENEDHGIWSYHSWEIDGETVETVSDFIFLGSKITADGDCSHEWMWELDCEESWTPKNWCFWTVVLEKTLESPLDCKEIQPVHSEGDQSWVSVLHWKGWC